jgi:hypothetical protein
MTLNEERPGKKSKRNTELITNIFETSHISNNNKTEIMPDVEEDLYTLFVWSFLGSF